MSLAGIYKAYTGIHASQIELDVAAEDLSNVNNKNHSRQAVTLRVHNPSELDFSGTRVYVGNGVSVASVARVIDQNAESTLRQSTSQQGKFNQLYEGLKTSELAMNEVKKYGISTALNDFYNSWSSLGSNPTDPGHRIAVTTQATQLSQKINSAYSSIQQNIGSLIDQRNQFITKINHLGSQITTLNQKISSTAGNPSNKLLDERDGYVLELAQLVNLNVVENHNGSVSINAGNFLLVDGNIANTFPSQYNSITDSYTDGSRNYKVAGGKLHGTDQAIAVVQPLLTNLDTFANNLVTTVNTIHASGKTNAGVTNIAFFNPPTGAANMAVNPVVAADPTQVVTGLSGNPGDGGLAISISDLSSAAQAGLSNLSQESYFQQLINSLASTTGAAKDQLMSQNEIVKQDEMRSQSVKGASQDEIMVNMLTIAKAYKAQAKVINIYDDLTENILSTLRR
jgi:flagellar hook-associated protein 1 FlgK